MFKCNDVKKIGRTKWFKDTLWLAYSGAGAEFIFKGTKAEITIQGDSTVTGDSSNFARVGIYVNDVCVVDDMMDKSEKTYCVWDSEESKECVVKILKLTESAMSTLGIKDIQVVSEEGIRPTGNKTHYIEFVGDSITCGYGVEDENPNHSFVTATENVTKAYAYKTAKKLGADYSMVSLSGYGIISGYTATAERKITEQLLPTYYKKIGFSYGEYLGEYPQNISWDFQERQPELIVVNLGTNDDSYTLDFKERQEEYAVSYLSFLKEIRKENPNATILCTLGIMGDRLYPYVEHAVSLYVKDTGDSNIYTMKFDVQKEEDGLVADWHPTERTHTKAADKLVSEIRKVMNWQ